MPVYPHPDEYRIIEAMGLEAFERSMPYVRVWLRDQRASFDPLLGESDPLFGEDEADPDDRVRGEMATTWTGPYKMRAHVVFQEIGPGGTTPQPSELGSNQAVTAEVRVPRQSLRLARMVEAEREDLLRMPMEGDVVEIHGDADERATHDKWGVGPWYFLIQDASYGAQIGASPYWTEYVLQTEMQTRFNPARLVGEAVPSTHPAEVVEER